MLPLHFVFVNNARRAMARSRRGLLSIGFCGLFLIIIIIGVLRLVWLAELAGNVLGPLLEYVLLVGLIVGPGLGSLVTEHVLDLLNDAGSFGHGAVVVGNAVLFLFGVDFADPKPPELLAFEPTSTAFATPLGNGRVPLGQQPFRLFVRIPQDGIIQTQILCIYTNTQRERISNRHTHILIYAHKKCLVGAKCVCVQVLTLCLPNSSPLFFFFPPRVLRPTFLLTLMV